MAAGDGATVTRIARDCGYRSTSQFSSDFHREFGQLPSHILWRSRHTQR
ncbi:MAG: helix-turn-helix domain-containing protein [Cyanobacteriota bacterium]